MTSIAQDKRSDALGKPPHPITPRPAPKGKSKHNMLCFNAFALTDARLTDP